MSARKRTCLTSSARGRIPGIVYLLKESPPCRTTHEGPSADYPTLVNIRVLDDKEKVQLLAVTQWRCSRRGGQIHLGCQDFPPRRIRVTGDDRRFVPDGAAEHQEAMHRAAARQGDSEDVARLSYRTP